MKRTALLIFSVLFLSVAFSHGGERDNLSVAFSPATDLRNARVVKTPRGDIGYTVSDLSASGANPHPETEFYLSFSGPAEKLGRDDTKLYQIRKANYRHVTGQGSFGTGSAMFYHQKHGIEVATEKGQWFGTCEDLGSFTVEFRIKPVALRDGSEILSRIAYASGAKTGFDIVIMKKRIVARFFNVFEDDHGRKVMALIDSGRQLEPEKWTHYLLSFDRMTGALATFIDGKETETVFLTATGRPEQGGFKPTFSPVAGGSDCRELPIVRIGHDLSGSLDELRVTTLDVKKLARRADGLWKRYRDPSLVDRTPHNFKGVVTSQVHQFSGTGTRVMDFSWIEELEKETHAWVEFRISDSLFYANDDELPWYRIKNGERKIYLTELPDGRYLRGRYYQWRLHLVPSPDGKRAPTISGIALTFQADPAPRIPLFFESLGAGTDSVTLRWMKNFEADMGGYKIYYGIRPGQYDGIISTVGGKPITNDMASGDYITVTIDNTVIEENMKNDPRKLLVYPKLRNDVLYFFGISAYDSYRVGTPHNHESAVSRPVTARPFGGNDIR